MLRIIAGKHKNRIIPMVKNAKYRPSTGRLRAAIFNILTSGEFYDAKLFSTKTDVLDLFSGTGSLAFEALSRGVNSITLVDINIGSLQVAQEFAALINESERAHFINLNALYLPKSTKNFGLVFIDPPYYNNLVPHAMNALVNGGWLKNGAILVVELAKTDDYLTSNMELMREKVYGNSKLLVLRYTSLLEERNTKT